jgi:O-antigen/teichoic acid export membrane protein
MTLKLFARDATIYAVGNIGLRAAALLLTPVYTYCLTVSEYGLWATLQTTIQIMLILFTMGMRETLLRFTKEYEEDNRLGFLIGTTTLVIVCGALGVSVVVLLLLLPVLQHVLHSDDARNLILLTCAAALMQSLSIHLMSYYRAGRQAIKFMITGLAGAVLLFATTFVAVYGLKLGVHGVLWAYIATYALVFTFVAADVFSRTGFGVSLSIIPRLLQFGAPLIVSAVGQFTMGGASVYLLSYFAGLEVVAIYSLSYKLASILPIVVALPFQLAFQPLVFSNLNNPDIRPKTGRLLTYLVLASTCMSFILVVGTHALLPFIAPPAYAAAFVVALFLVPAQAFSGIHGFGETLLGAVNKTHIAAFFNTGGAVVCILLNLMLVPLLGWYGAAIATGLSLIVVDTTEAAIGIKEFKIRGEIEGRRLFILGAVFVAFLGLSFALCKMPDLVFYSGEIAFCLASLAVLCAFPFFHGYEKAAVRQMAQDFAARIRRQRSPSC